MSKDKKKDKGFELEFSKSMRPKQWPEPPKEDNEKRVKDSGDDAKENK